MPKGEPRMSSDIKAGIVIGAIVFICLLIWGIMECIGKKDEIGKPNPHTPCDTTWEAIGKPPCAHGDCEPCAHGMCGNKGCTSEYRVRHPYEPKESEENIGEEKPKHWFKQYFGCCGG